MTSEYISTVIGILQKKVGMEKYESILQEKITDITMKATSHVSSLRKYDYETYELYEGEEKIGDFWCQAYSLKDNRIILDKETADLFREYNKKKNTIEIVRKIISEPCKDDVKEAFPVLIPVLDEADIIIKMAHEKQRDDVLDLKKDLNKFLKKYRVCAISG